MGEKVDTVVHSQLYSISICSVDHQAQLEC